MIVVAILGTVAAVLWTLLVMFANGMRSSPGKFYGDGLIWAGWGIAALLWFVWALGATA